MNASPNFERYGRRWAPTTSDLEVELGCIRLGGSGTHKGKPWGLGLYEHYKRAMLLAWPDHEWHRWIELGLTTIIKNDITVMLGCGDCVTGNTLIEDPTTGIARRIDDLTNAKIRPTVMTLDGPVLADVPYLKGEDEIFEVECVSGASFQATGKHRVLTAAGHYAYVADLLPGVSLIEYSATPPESTGDNAPLIARRDERHYSRTIPNSRCDYHHISHSCDAPLPLVSNVSPKLSPSPIGVQTRSPNDWRWDVPVSGCKCTPPYPHASRLSNDHSLPPASKKTTLACECGTFSSVLERAVHLCEQPLRLREWMRSPQPSLEPVRHFPRISSLTQYTVGETQIKKIRRIGVKKFYDIHVPKVHHYFANGFVHHNSGKTELMGMFALIDWWCFPKETLWLVSSTTINEAKIKIWGAVCRLFNDARDRWGEEILPGTVSEQMHAITEAPSSKDGKRARLLQRGLVLVPCKRGKDFVGMGAYMGSKAPRLRHAGDELSVMNRSFLDVFSNFYGKRDFKSVMSANPWSTTDPSCIAAEPMEGWENWIDTGKTQTWRSKFFNAAVISFDGRDSPNFDYPQDQPPHYHYLVGKKKFDGIIRTHGTNTWHYWMQCVGKPNRNLVSKTVLTRQLCEEHHAFDKAIWQDTRHVKIYGLDPNYGGEDRCIGGMVEFGMGADGVQLLKLYPPENIPVSVLRSQSLPEDQIAQYVKIRLASLGIEPENCFYDATGKGTLGAAFARVFHGNNPIAIDSGAVPTQRPVRYDEFIGTGAERRLKTCYEAYSKFVTEMWYSFREAVETEQIRELPHDVMEELSSRLYEIVKGNKVEVETKEDLRERIRCSPDLGDWAAISLEGARQRGFKIGKLGLAVEEASEESNPWQEQEDEYSEAIENALLIH